MTCMKKNAILLILAVTLLFCFVCGLVAIAASSITPEVAFAGGANTDVDIYELCKVYTDDINLQIDAESTILQYEAYIDERFNIGGSSQSAEGITDEWIFQIIPKAVFDMPPMTFCT